MKKHFDDSWENWDKSMKSNSRGLFVTCRAFARSMADHGWGSIINVASIYGIVAPDPQIYEGTDMFTEPDYPFHNGGMIMFTKYLSLSPSVSLSLSVCDSLSLCLCLSISVSL